MSDRKDQYYAKRAHLTYEEVIDDLLIINFQSLSGSPIEKVMRLISYEVYLALDPCVSLAAVELIKKYGGTYHEVATDNSSVVDPG